MSNDTMLGGLYLLMAIMLILGTLITRREPIAKTATMALAWIAIFAATGVILSAAYALFLYRRIIFGDLVKDLRIFR